MTRGELLYEAERSNALQAGELLPRWCELDGPERQRWIERGLNEQAHQALLNGGALGSGRDRCKP